MFLGRGDSSFTPRRSIPVGFYPQESVVADLDNDGRRDLAVVNFGSEDVSILRGAGDGNFGPASHYPVGGAPRALEVADVDHDGNLDLIVGNQNGFPRLALLRGDGTGGFGAPEAVVSDVDMDVTT